MKRIKQAYFLPLVLTLIVTSVMEVHASPPEASEKMGREILEGLKDAETMNQDIQLVGKPVEHCPGCGPKGPDLKIELVDRSHDLGKPYYLRENEPYIIYIKRTAKTPAKIDLKFKNGYEYCERMYMESNPWAPGGPLILGCMLYLTHYEEEEISLNLKKLKALKEGQEEVIEVRLSKSNTRKAKYEITVKHLSDDSVKEEIGKKFLGGGYNVSFEAP